MGGGGGGREVCGLGGNDFHVATFHMSSVIAIEKQLTYKINHPFQCLC